VKYEYRQKGITNSSWEIRSEKSIRKNQDVDGIKIFNEFLIQRMGKCGRINLARNKFKWGSFENIGFSQRVWKVTSVLLLKVVSQSRYRPGVTQRVPGS